MHTGGTWSIHLDADKIGAHWQPQLDECGIEDPPLLISRPQDPSGG